MFSALLRGFDRLMKRRVRTPLLLQLETTECGAACLGIVLSHHGLWIPIAELREACSVGRDGCVASDLTRAARQYGLVARGWRKESRHLPAMPMPAIIYWAFNHFLVLEGFGRGKYFLNDPGNGHRVVGEEEFDRNFTGIILTFEPDKDFQPGGSRAGIMRRIWPWLRGVKKPLGFAVACGLLLTVPVLATPMLLNIFVDYVLSGREPSWAAAIIGALLAAAVFLYVLTWLRQRCLKLLAIRLSVDHADHFIRRLFTLPMQYFAHRFAGDLNSRLQSIDRISLVTTTQLVSVILELITSALFLVMMFTYAPGIALVVVAVGALLAVLMRALSTVRTDENRKLQREQGMLDGVGMAGLMRIDALQATAAEDDFFSGWSGYQARELLARQRFSELGHVTASLPGVFMILGNAAVLWLGGWQVMNGAMTVGMLMAFYMMATGFLSPIGRFVQLTDLFQVLEADLQRLDDVLDTPADSSFDGRAIIKDMARDMGRNGAPGESAGEATFDATAEVTGLNGRLRLGGRIELRAVTFGYQNNRPPLLEGFNLAVAPGQRVAIVGSSGAGKSTLSALVSGIYAPWSGEILFDGEAREGIPREVLTGSISLVDQRIFLFAGTVRENLTMWRPETPDEDLVKAGRDASIHGEIMLREHGYDSPVDEQGRNFSGGQRQRLEIARALVNNPAILILDEATSVLDTVNEARIDDALRRRGCTCLIIAHRLSTIRDCDLIVVLDKGREIQRGTHQTLMADAGGTYRKLMDAN